MSEREKIAFISRCAAGGAQTFDKLVVKVLLARVKELEAELARVDTLIESNASLPREQMRDLGYGDTEVRVRRWMQWRDEKVTNQRTELAAKDAEIAELKRISVDDDHVIEAQAKEIAALEAEVERLKLSEARVKELEHERNKAMGERNRALTREKEANEGWSQAQARVKELEASEKQHDADTDLPIPEGNCLACKGTGMRGPDWICGACAGSGIVRPSDD